MKHRTAKKPNAKLPADILLNYIDTGQGSPVVFVHGMTASLRYWQDITQEVSKTHRVIAVDLLGFGHSPKSSAVRYGPATHIACIMKTLDHAGVTEPFTVVGHSMGALLALRMGAMYPRKIKKMVLVSMPVYRSPEESQKHITKGTKIRQLAYYGWTSRLLCTTWCTFLRPLSRRLAPMYIKNQPKRVAEDGVLHSWQSFSQSLEHVIANQDVEKDLLAATGPVSLIYGTSESKITLDNLHRISVPAFVEVEMLEGTHNLPLEHPDYIAQLATK